MNQILTNPVCSLARSVRLHIVLHNPPISRTMGFRMTRGDLAAAPDLWKELSAHRASFKKRDERVKYLNKIGGIRHRPRKDARWSRAGENPRAHGRVARSNQDNRYTSFFSMNSFTIHINQLINKLENHYTHLRHQGRIRLWKASGGFVFLLEIIC